MKIKGKQVKVWHAVGAPCAAKGGREQRETKKDLFRKVLFSVFQKLPKLFWKRKICECIIVF